MRKRCLAPGNVEIPYPFEWNARYYAVELTAIRLREWRDIETTDASGFPITALVRGRGNYEIHAQGRVIGFTMPTACAQELLRLVHGREM